MILMQHRKIFFLRSRLQLSTFTSQFVVEISQLSQKSIIGSDFPMLTDFGQCFDSGHVLPQHQVGQHASTGAGHAHKAVDEHFAWKLNA